MAVHPIEERYGTAEMRAVWSEQNRFSCIIRAEVALAKAEAACGMIPPAAALEIEAKAPAASLDRAKEIEAEISHDMMAIVKAISEVCGESGRWVHYGATSNDILDTATGLQLGQSLDLLEDKLRKLLAVLLKRADETKTLVCIGRTHGQHGVPTTYGLRFAIWAGEVGRHLERLSEIRPRVVVGQMTGAVGTQAALGPKGMEVQAAMMEHLGMSSVDVSNQVIARDRYAEYFMFCAGVATTLDKIGVEIRSLQRTEIGEVEEPFGSKQVGSSTMPHKRNPIKSEQVCGLARIVRAAVEPALLNNTLWDERDLTNSSTERIIFPESSILTDHCLRLMTVVIDGLVINRAAIRRNLAFLHGINMAESVMIELTKRGMNRQDSHERVRMASMQALAEGKALADVLATDPEVIRYCAKTEIAALLNPDAYTGTAVQQVERLVKKLSGMTTGREQPRERIRKDTALHPGLIFTAAHELRTHLQPIMGYLNLLTEDSAVYGITDESRVILDRCVKSVDRENQIINQMLAISVLDAGKIPLSCSVVTVRDLIQTVVDKGGYAAKADLVIDAPPDTTMDADESKLSIVIDSLLLNAVDFSKPPRKIRVAYEFSDSEQMHRISVQDNGVGITNTQLDEIFEPFTLSGHGGKNRKYNRVGFSLSIAKKYVQMHGGYISVNSIVNLGSTFTIHIPKTPASVESCHGS